jgi:hypothetical protein
MVRNYFIPVLIGDHEAIKNQVVQIVRQRKKEVPA